MSTTPTPETGAVKRRVAELREHPRADQVPPPDADAYAGLRADIAERNVQVPLEVTPEGVVLDGRARLQIARELGITELEVVIITVEDELEHMQRRALHRRHLGPGQCAALAVMLADTSVLREQADERRQANLRRGSARPEVATLPARGERTREQLARISGASPRTVQDALAVADNDPKLLDRVLRGELSASVAASKVRRALRDAAIPPPAAMPTGPFPVLYADPPWALGSPDSRFAPEQHYPTMPLEQIKALKLPADADAVLFLWAVTSRLPEALEVITAWGFTYRSAMVWVKNGTGPGVWLLHRHELLLIAIKGKMSPPEPADRVDSVIEAPRRRHSEKPEAAYERIERMYPNLPKLELFARGAPRPGWTIWGNQAETDPEANGDPEAEPSKPEPTDSSNAKPEKPVGP